MSHGKCTGPVLLKNIVRSLDEKCILGVLKLQISTSFQGLCPLAPDQGFAQLDPLGVLTAPSNGQVEHTYVSDITDIADFFLQIL